MFNERFEFKLDSKIGHQISVDMSCKCELSGSEVIIIKGGVNMTIMK